ncbi:MAG: hypothetical protein Q9225_002243 [Loekoesia sp. 1 TL-2023]
MTDEPSSLHDSQNINLEVSCVKATDSSFHSWNEVPFCTQRSPLSSPPSTPRRAIANSGRKRAPPRLSRDTPQPGHCKKMSAIFQNASRVLHHPVTPHLLSTHSRRLPMPLVETSSIRTGFIEAGNGSYPPHRVLPQEVHTQHQAGSKLSSPTPLLSKKRASAEGESCDDIKAATERIDLQTKPLMDEMGGVEPTSSGYASPIARKVQNPQLNSDEVVYPDLTAISASAASDAALGTAKVERDSGFPLSHIEDWLVDVHDHSPPDPTKAPASPPGPTVKGVSPSSIPVASGLKRWRSPRSESSYHPPVRFSHPRIPGGHLTEPAKRKVTRLSLTKRELLADQGQQIVVSADDTSDQAVELSPCVERYRKGRGPKRERCASYWDTDVLPELANTPGERAKEQNGRHVLGELPSLTRVKGFVEGVENAQFDFQVYF